LTITNELLKQKAHEIDEYVRTTRRFLHENPEPFGKEYETSKFLQEEVKKLGMTVEMVSNTGFIATFETGKPGKTIVLRTDIDALPMPEDPNNLKGPKKYVSKVDGVCHACGHDGHMAMLLGTAKVLHDMKDQLSGTILLCFEEGEEAGVGIKDMIKVLKTKTFDAAWAIHLTSFMPVGTINIDPGPRMAGVTWVELDINGRGGHGSRPDLSINPVFAAANVLTGIGSAWPNRIDAEETVTLGLTTIHGGTAANIIPDSVKVTGTLRYFNVAEGKKAVETLESVARYTAKAHNCEIEFTSEKIGGQLPTINDPDLSKQFTEGLKEVLPEGSFTSGNKWFASETFSQYGQLAPAILAFIGIGNPELGSGAEHHNVKFDMDEDALEMGVLSTLKIVTDFLK